MTDELDLGIDPAQAKALREEAAKEPCFGGCGKSWEKAGGGWFEFEPAGNGEGTQLAPKWYCDPCHTRRSAEIPGTKAGVETKH